MLLNILISFVIVICSVVVCFCFAILLIKIFTKIESYLDKKRNELGKELYEGITEFIKAGLMMILLVIFLTFMVYNFIF